MDTNVIREPRTGVGSDIDLRELKPDDVVRIQIDDLPTEAQRTKIISVGPMLMHRELERWITGFYRDIRCRVLGKGEAMGSRSNRRIDLTTGVKGR